MLLRDSSVSNQHHLKLATGSFAVGAADSRINKVGVFDTQGAISETAAWHPYADGLW
jgi:hypothetical protein